MEKKLKLDRIDLQILQALQKNARLSMKELSAQVSLSTTPVFERFKRLEREGIIKQYTTVLDADRLHQSFMVFCNVKMSKINTDINGAFAQLVCNMPQVTECYNISGSFDFLLKIHAPNMEYYRDFILNSLGRFEYIASIESIFVMNEIKHEWGIKVSELLLNDF